MQRTRKYVKAYRFLSFAKKYEQKLLNTGLDAVKTASKKVVHKASEFLGNKIADAITNSNDNKIVKQEPVKKQLFRQKKAMKY